MGGRSWGGRGLAGPRQAATARAPHLVKGVHGQQDYPGHIKGLDDHPGHSGLPRGTATAQAYREAEEVAAHLSPRGGGARRALPTKSPPLEARPLQLESILAPDGGSCPPTGWVTGRWQPTHQWRRPPWTVCHAHCTRAVALLCKWCVCWCATGAARICTGWWCVSAGSAQCLRAGGACPSPQHCCCRKENSLLGQPHRQAHHHIRPTTTSDSVAVSMTYSPCRHVRTMG